MTTKPTVPAWQKVIAVCLLILIGLLIGFGWHRFLSDFWPVDASRVGPNLVASIVQWVVLLIAVALFYPPARHAMERFAQRHVDAIKAHVTAEHAAFHDKLDHIIKYHPDIPPFHPEGDPTMTTMETPPQPYMKGRLPIKPEGERFAIKWLHEYDADVAPAVAPPVVYPVDVSQGITDWLMLGNGPDPTLTITTPNGPGAPVGDCGFAGKDHDKMLGGYAPTANGTVAQYDIYDQGVDQGVVVADMLLWLRTHDEAGTVVTVAEGDVELFAPVHPDTLAATMVKYRRGVLLGVNLTSCDQNNFPTGWTVTPSCQPDTNEGHVVYLAKINADGSGELVSWGALVPADAAWMKAAPEEWWILLTSADRAKMGEAAFDALAADLAALPGSTGTAPVPPPPAPAPDPGPPVPEPPNPPVPPAPSPIPVPPIDPPVPPVPLPPTHESWWQEVQEWVAAWKAWIINTGGVPVPGDEEVES